MKKICSTLIKSTVVASALVSSCYASNCFTPYVGADYTHGMTKGKGDLSKVLPNNFDYGRIFVGTKFNDYFGAELGYRQSSKKSKTTRGLEIEETPLSISVTEFNYKLSAKKQAFDFDLNGYYPLNNCVELVGTVGLAAAKLSITDSDEKITERAVLPHFGVGLNYKLTDNWAVRGRVNYEINKGLKYKDVDTGSKHTIYKNEIGVGVGIQYSF